MNRLSAVGLIVVAVGFVLYYSWPYMLNLWDCPSNVSCVSLVYRPIMPLFLVPFGLVLVAYSLLRVRHLHLVT
jgi:TRAP-type C4-dicarboxylate transport system permease small subunit